MSDESIEGKNVRGTLSPAGPDDAAQVVDAGEAASCETPPQATHLRWLSNVRNARELGIFLAAATIFIVLAILAPRFLNPSNLLNVAREISMKGIIAVGMTYVFISGELDLSVGSQYGFFAAVVALMIQNWGMDPWIAMVLAVVLGAGVGLFNGLITTKFVIPSFIVTLGMLSILRGATLLLTNGWPINLMVESPMFNATGGYLFDVIPIQILWMGAIMIVAGWVLAKTKFGYHTYATGGNKLAARLSGINTDKIKILCFMLISALTALTGAMYIGWLKVASPLAGSGLELDVIAAVIIGGASLNGGSGTILGTFLGALIMGMITNGLVLLGVSAYFEPVAKGSIIIGAVLLDNAIRRRT